MPAQGRVFSVSGKVESTGALQSGLFEHVWSQIKGTIALAAQAGLKGLGALSVAAPDFKDISVFFSRHKACRVFGDLFLHACDLPVCGSCAVKGVLNALFHGRTHVFFGG